MNKTKIILAILANMIMGTTLPLVEQKPKSRWKHFKECFKGNEPCTKTDFAILGTSLLVARSSFYALLAVGEYRYEPSTHTVEASPDKVKREGLIGDTARTINRVLKWGPGRFPKRIARKARIWWSTT